MTDCVFMDCGTAVQATGDTSVEIDGLLVIDTPEAIVSEDGATVKARRVFHLSDDGS